MTGTFSSETLSENLEWIKLTENFPLTLKMLRWRPGGHVEFQKAEQQLLRWAGGKMLVFIDQARHGSTVKNPEWFPNFAVLGNPLGIFESMVCGSYPSILITRFRVWLEHQEGQQSLGANAGDYKLPEGKDCMGLLTIVFPALGMK